MLMKHSVKTIWKNEMAFASDIDGNVLNMNADGSAPSPKKLLLASLAGCTGMDVVSLLEKMRVPFTGLELDVESELTEEHPKVYKSISLTYIVYGKDLDTAKVEKAVRLSKEKYCGVSAMLAKNSPIEFNIQYKEA